METYVHMAVTTGCLSAGSRSGGWEVLFIISTGYLFIAGKQLGKERPEGSRAVLVGGRIPE